MREVLRMTVCYNKLWKLLIDKNMKKKDLRLAPLTDFRLFDLYRPKEGEGAGEKSLAFAIELNSRTDEALNDEQTEGAVRAILEVLEEKGARLRQ